MGASGSINAASFNAGSFKVNVSVLPPEQPENEVAALQAKVTQLRAQLAAAWEEIATLKSERKEEKKDKDTIADDVFTLIDRNHDGVITRQEFKEGEIKALLDEVTLLRQQNKRGGYGWAQEDNDDKPGLQGLLVKVNHVSLVVSDAEASKKFYCDLLGATIMNRPNFPKPGYWLWLGNVQLHLIQSPNAAIEASHAPGIATGDVNHISFEVHDFAAVEAKLKKIKASYKKNRVPEGDSVIHQLFMTDPDGHYVEICDCNRFSDFVFGPPPDPAELKAMASKYLDGVDPTGASVAAVAALAFVPGQSGAKTEDDFNNSLGMLQRAFKVFAGGDDYIETSELGSVLKRMGQDISDQELTDLVTSLDEDGSGRIGFPEFAKFMAPRLKPDNSNAELKKSFDIIDRDKSGTIEANELLLMLYGIGQRMDEEQLETAIKQADKNGDHRIDFDEFLTIFNGLQNGLMDTAIGA
mmetsp:Transcript_109629/g.244941  ORF Transcript_109629/g.244941 Transcript_109629/m.244941 type:complete len:468 (+) Transcript_109629:89-1492(+)